MERNILKGDAFLSNLLIGGIHVFQKLQSVEDSVKIKGKKTIHGNTVK